MSFYQAGGSATAVASDLSDYKNKHGFIDYNHSGSVVQLPAGSWIDIPNNGSGSFSNDTYKPTSVTSLLDTSTGYFDASELALGDVIIIRNDYTVVPNTNNGEFEFRYALGSGSGEYSLSKAFGVLSKGAGIDHAFSLRTDLVYIGDNNTRNNPIKLQIKLSVSGSFTNSGSVIQVIPNS